MKAALTLAPWWQIHLHGIHNSYVYCRATQVWKARTIPLMLRILVRDPTSQFQDYPIKQMSGYVHNCSLKIEGGLNWSNF